MEDNIKETTVFVKGEPQKILLNYNVCRFYYNDKEGKFWVQPWDDTHKEWYSHKPEGGYRAIGANAKTFNDEMIRRFTTIIDVMKMMFGSRHFTYTRVSLLWDAYQGNVNIFDSKKDKHFFPVNKQRYGNIITT